MNRLALLTVAAAAGLSGCASPARYVEKTTDSGIVAIPAPTDSWPTYNRSAAQELIRKHVGPNFEIVSEGEAAVGTSTLNNQRVNTEQGNSSMNPLMPAQRQTVTNTSLTQNVTEWRIAYRKKTPASFVGTTGGMPGMPIGGSMPIGGGMPAGGNMPMGGGSSVGPAGGMGAPAIGTPTMSTPPGVQQTQYVPAAGMGLGAQPAPGVVPPVGPVGGPISPVGGGGHTTGWGP